MNRITEKFRNLQKDGKKAFIGFITSGDPNLRKTVDFALALENAGVDILELGVPFSDPVAEGVVIQSASERALSNGIKIDNIFEMTAELRERTQIPLLYMLYINSIYVYGKEKFFQNCQRVGVDGVIIPDLPFEEQGEVAEAAARYGVFNISLVAPTSKERIAKIAANAEGFIYCVSSGGVTGVRKDFTTDFGEFSEEIRKHAKVPIAVGFGISDPETAKKLSLYFDGVIMGSAFVRLIAEHGADAAGYISELAKNVRGAL
ncbi:tryptophan synthase alpha chain [Clostridia bacterium]|nr:tryptophan synthase alpha chain [Clostridia bacterium]